MYQEARERDAKMVAVTSGGALARLAQQDGIPLLTVSYRGEPRSALGYSFIAPLAILCKLGLLKDKADDLTEAIQGLRDLVGTLAPDVPQSENLAKEVATFLHGRLTVVYGAGFLRGVAQRWKTQLNENSKGWAFAEALPELNHNAVQGLALPDEIRQRVAIVLLHSSLLHPRISLRYRVTRELLAQEDVLHRQLECSGHTPLAHLLGAIMVGDYVSYYLAMLNRVDPAATPVLNQVKDRMARAEKEQ